MSEAITLLNDLRGRGLRVTIAGPNLRIVPKPADAELVDRLRAHKAELMVLLKEQAEVERVARLDAAHHERDRLAGRGCDYDRRIPARSIIQTCADHGVRLLVEPDGTLVVRGPVWRSLLDAVEAHADEIVVLLTNGMWLDA
jgi:hypothetical protein